MTESSRPPVSRPADDNSSATSTAPPISARSKAAAIAMRAAVQLGADAVCRVPDRGGVLSSDVRRRPGVLIIVWSGLTSGKFRSARALTIVGSMPRSLSPLGGGGVERGGTRAMTRKFAEILTRSNPQSLGVDRSRPGPGLSD
jgi:hypothetical protein